MADPKLVEKAQNEYGIVNADQMSDKQLNAEIKAIDDQPKSSDEYEAPRKTAKARSSSTSSAPKKASAKNSKRNVVRNALNGHFSKRNTAKENPATTETEKV